MVRRSENRIPESNHALAADSVDVVLSVEGRNEPAARLEASDSSAVTLLSVVGFGASRLRRRWSRSTTTVRPIGVGNTTRPAVKPTKRMIATARPPTIGTEQAQLRAETVRGPQGQAGDRVSGRNLRIGEQTRSWNCSPPNRSTVPGLLWGSRSLFLLGQRRIKMERRKRYSVRWGFRSTFASIEKSGLGHRVATPRYPSEMVANAPIGATVTPSIGSSIDTPSMESRPRVRRNWRKVSTFRRVCSIQIVYLLSDEDLQTTSESFQVGSMG